MNREEYLERMSTNYSFKRMNIMPEWFPGEGDVSWFCHDEVVRQGHDPRHYGDGGQRVEWMPDAWNYARAKSGEFNEALITTIRVGQLVEDINRNVRLGYIDPRERFRAVGVYIGNRWGPPVETIPLYMRALCEQASRVQPGRADLDLFKSYTSIPMESSAPDFAQQVEGIRTIDDWYLAYEWIHPWPDGNGRSGKVLHNWLLGTLDDPVLIDDYFGGGNP